MNTVLDVTSGICWSVVYVIAIIQGVRYKTWCIPAIPICLNFSWEFWVVWNRVSNGSVFNIPFAVQLVWFVLDIGVLGTWLVYGTKKKKDLLKKALLFSVILLVMYLVTQVAGLWEFSSFLINAIMSLAFIIRLARDSISWTSRIIAVAKLIGTLAATFLVGWVYRNLVVLWLGGVCLVLDFYYIFRLKKFYEAR